MDETVDETRYETRIGAAIKRERYSPGNSISLNQMTSRFQLMKRFDTIGKFNRVHMSRARARARS